MKIYILEQALSPYQLLAEHEKANAGLRGKAGATASFVGTMRDNNEDDAVTAMTLEHYPQMTEKHLEKIAERANARWELLDVLIAHRVGDLTPGDPIVLVAAWSKHRKDAFEASRFIMEDLKSQAPFWKKEKLIGGDRWVKKNTPGF
ncbi:MAG: molybdenum cofactor biosynthesis protein MoaE [Gammaproteobacteria bacterium]